MNNSFYKNLVTKLIIFALTLACQNRLDKGKRKRMNNNYLPNNIEPNQILIDNNIKLLKLINLYATNQRNLAPLNQKLNCLINIMDKEIRQINKSLSTDINQKTFISKLNNNILNLYNCVLLNTKAINKNINVSDYNNENKKFSFSDYMLFIEKNLEKIIYYRNIAYISTSIFNICNSYPKKNNNSIGIIPQNKKIKKRNVESLINYILNNEQKLHYLTSTVITLFGALDLRVFFKHKFCEFYNDHITDGIIHVINEFIGKCFFVSNLHDLVKTS